MRRSRRSRFQQGRPIVAFDGVETMNDAEALAGAELKVPARGAADRCPTGTFYQHDLVGCEVVDTTRRDDRAGDGGRRADGAEPPGGRRRARRSADSAGRGDLRRRSTSARAADRGRSAGRAARAERGRDERRTSAMKIDIVTIFPEMVRGAARGRRSSAGRSRAGCSTFGCTTCATYTTDRHRVVDDVPFGGGPGMVMKPEPLFRGGRGDSRRARGAGRGDPDDAGRAGGSRTRGASG